jgi:recombinational DNA repair protein RecR
MSQVRACSVDRYKVEAEDDDDVLPAKIERHLEEAAPKKLRVYVMYKNESYCAELSASELAKKLKNGACQLCTALSQSRLPHLCGSTAAQASCVTGRALVAQVHDVMQGERS